MTIEAGVTVGERDSGELAYVAYGLNHAGNPSWQKKEASGGAGNEPASDASIAASKLDDVASMPIRDGIRQECARRSISASTLPTARK